MVGAGKLPSGVDPAAFTPADSPLTYQDVVDSPEYRDLMTPKVHVAGPAFDFALPLLDCSSGWERHTGRIVTLGDHFGVRPVALIFGSYT